MEYKAVVVDEPDSRGKVVITEKLTFDIHAASKNNLFWELWRDLPEYYVDGVKTSYNVLSVKQILEDGTEVIYEESPKLYWYDSDYVSTHPKYGPGKWFHSEGPYDEDEAQILLPNEDMPRPGNYDTFTYGTSSNVFLSRSLLPLTLVDMGITPHTPTQNRTCPIKAYGFSLYIHTTCKTGLP